jgi:hypothetical protein
MGNPRVIHSFKKVAIKARTSLEVSSAGRYHPGQARMVWARRGFHWRPLRPILYVSHRGHPAPLGCPLLATSRQIRGETQQSFKSKRRRVVVPALCRTERTDKLATVDGECRRRGAVDRLETMDAEWHERLTANQHRITRRAGVELARAVTPWECGSTVACAEARLYSDQIKVRFRLALAGFLAAR